jgi:hypothetical protein
MGRLGIALAAAVLVALPVTVRAEDVPLAQARAAVDASDYMTARTALQKALDAGGAEPDELAEIYKLTGIVDAALGNTKDATAAFGKWLALEPKGTLPQGTSPKITRPFDAARKKAPKLEVKTESNGDPPWVSLVIVNDPIGISKVRVLVTVDGKPQKDIVREGNGSQKIPVDLPHGHRLDVQLEALDVHGNRIAVFGSKEVPIVVITPEKAPPDHVVDNTKHEDVKKHPVLVHAEPVSWSSNWHVWGIATGVALLATGALAYETYSSVSDLNNFNANSLDHRFSDAQSAESNARHFLLATNIGAGVTGALALGTLFFYWTRPHDEVQLVATPLHGGGAFAIGGRF